MRFAVDRLDHLVVTCRDVTISASWYQRVLGMEVEEFGLHTRTALKFGGQKINLRPVEATQAEWWTGVAGGVPGTADLCFIVTVDAEQIVAHLHHCGVAVEQGPVAKTRLIRVVRHVASVTAQEFGRDVADRPAR